MGCFSSQSQDAVSWRDLEAGAASRRQKLSAIAMMEILGPSGGGQANQQRAGRHNHQHDLSCLPRMGLCLSGGGWRAMTSGVAMFDALSIPCETTASGRKVKPLDCFSHAFGLSGGSWMLLNTLAGASRNYKKGAAGAKEQEDHRNLEAQQSRMENHQTQNAKSGHEGGFYSLLPSSKIDLPASYNPFHDVSDNPWLYGEDHYFDPRKHNYNGLVHMVDKTVVDEACNRGSFRKSIGYLSTRIGADATIAAVLASKHLGPTLVERWASFIGADLLGWMDPSWSAAEGISKRVSAQATAAQSTAAAKLGAASSFLSKVSGGKLGSKRSAAQQAQVQQDLEKEWQEMDRLPSRNLHLGDMQGPILDGSLPFIVVTAISNRVGVTQEQIDNQAQLNEELKEQSEANNSLAGSMVDGERVMNGSSLNLSENENEATSSGNRQGNARSPLELCRQPRLQQRHHKRLYDWVEFSPFFARKLGGDSYSSKKKTIADCYASAWEVQGQFATYGPTKQLNLHHLMSVCGSAFACDLSCALPTGVQARLTKNHQLNKNPLIGRGTTTVSSSRSVAEEQNGNKNVAPAFGECRDAGIDFNVPLPPMLSEAGREFDIIVVMDAGAGSVNAHELQRCIDLGYIEAPHNVHPHSKFGKTTGKFVRVFRHPRGPTILYFIGLVDRGTHRIICTEQSVRSDCARLRERVTRQLVPTIIAEMNGFKSKLEAKKYGGISGGGLGKYGGDEPVFTALDEEVLMDGDDGDEDDNLPSDEALSEEVKAIMLSAAATGKVKNEYDAFRAVEEVILFGNAQIPPQERQAALKELEGVALQQILGAGGGSTTGEFSLRRIPVRALKELQQYDVVAKNGVVGSNSAMAGTFASSASPASGGNAGEYGQYGHQGPTQMQQHHSLNDPFATPHHQQQQQHGSPYSPSSPPRQAAITEPWVAYYAALGLARHLVQGDTRLLQSINRGGEGVTEQHLQQQNSQRQLRSQPNGHQQGFAGGGISVGSVPLHVKSKLWAHLAQCLQFATTEVGQGTDQTIIHQTFAPELCTNFEAFVANRNQFNEGQKVQALTNVAQALVECGLEDHLNMLIERHGKGNLSSREKQCVCETAARTGAMRVLQHMASNWPSNLDQPSVLAASYACTDPEVSEWLKNERGVKVSFIDCCKNGWYEAVKDKLTQSDKHRDSRDGAMAALNNNQEVVANILYSRGSAQYREWLAQEVHNRRFAWNTILRKAAAAKAIAVGAKAAAPEAPRQMGDVALDAASRVASKAENALKGIMKFKLGRKKT